MADNPLTPQSAGSEEPQGGVDKYTATRSEPYSRTAQELPPGESPPGSGPSGETLSKGSDSDSWLIQQAQQMYADSTDYLESNVTNTWERNLSHFHGEHAPSSAYRKKDFKRSRVFRPKTRANTKAQESSLASALFSTINLISVQAEDSSDQKQVLSAAINQNLVHHRLENSVPWFLTTQGAYQDTKVYGLCISHQYWAYEEDTDVEPAFEDGKPVVDDEGTALGYETSVVRRDELCIDLIEPENFRFDPMCDWRNPAGTSPYLVMLTSMFVGEALEMMEKTEVKTGQPAWRKYSMAELLSTRRESYNRTRQARAGRERSDPADEKKSSELTTVWPHLNIKRINGTDMAWWTMGTELLLTDPIKLTEMYPHLRERERPFVVGYSAVEAHRNYPSGDVEQGSQLQEEINLVANQRLDNVKLVLNKRYYVRRGSQVDLDALIRNTPGGGVMMNDPEKDVVTVNTPDVTGSSYTEQAALSSEFDELAGGFNPATAQQKSVGSMTMAGAAANSVQDYGIKIFVETWVEPVLRQVVRLIQMYETDQRILALAGNKAEAFSKFGVNELTDDLLQQNLLTRVDVSMGNTDPMRRVERLVFGATKVAELPGMAMRLKGLRVAEEIFGSLGYRDSSAFVMGDEEWAEYLEANPEGPSDIDVKMKELEIRDGDNKMRDERERMKLDLEREALDKGHQVKVGTHQDDLAAKDRQTKLTVQQQRDKAIMDDKTKRDTAAMQAVQKTRDSNIKQFSGGSQ